MALCDDLVADRGVERTVDVVEQQRARVAVAEPVDPELGQPAEDVVAHARARREHERDPLGEEPARDETEDLRRRVVEPLRVVDDADERLLLGDLGEQRQRGEPHQEAVGRRAGARPNTVASASRCGPGSRSRWSSIGAQSWCRPL